MTTEQDDSEARKKQLRDERRAAMPKSTAFCDSMRKDFGELVYIKASENGFSVEWGSKLQNGKEAD